MFKRVVLLFQNLHDDSDREKALKAVLAIRGVHLVHIDRTDSKMKVIGTMNTREIVRNLMYRNYMGVLWSIDSVAEGVIERWKKKKEKTEEDEPKEGGEKNSDASPSARKNNDNMILNRDQTNHHVLGREIEKKKLIELLHSDECRSNSVSFVSIVAAAGMGKTTFAHLVYNDPLVRSRFEAQVWVCLSWINDIEGLFRAVLESLTGVSCTLTELSDLSEVVKEKLKGKRILIVLDNYCKDDEGFISDVFIRFSQLRFSAKGNIVLFTTRKMTESANVFCRSFFLNPLSKEDCRMILQVYAIDGKISANFPKIEIKDPPVSEITRATFRRHSLNYEFSATPFPVSETRRETFSLGAVDFKYSAIFSPISKTTNATITRGAVDVDELILPACNGSPLSARLLRSLLHLTAIDQLNVHLKNAIQEQGQNKSGNNILPTLELWMSQGLIKSRYGEKDEEVGTTYFDDLLNRSFFQSSPIHNTRSYYQVHNLVHDFALSNSREEMLQLDGSKICSFSAKLCHVSFIGSGLDSSINVESLKECPNLLSLFVISRSYLEWGVDRIHIQNPESLNALFTNLVCMKTLDLSFSDIKELPSTIQNLRNLRYLGLNYTYIGSLPESLCSLRNLQTLGLNNCVDLTELPKNLNNLIGLRSLDIWKDSEFISVPQGIGLLTDLRILTAFHVGEASIGELENLVMLRGKLQIGGLNYVSNGKEAMEANLFDKRGLRNLIFHWSDNECESDSDLEQGTASEVFENLQPCIKLEELTVKGYPGAEFPSWFGIPQFSNLNSITLDNCYQSEVLPMLGKLPSLKHLFIRKMDQVRRVGREFCGPYKNAFPSLEILKIYELYHWEVWNGVEDGDFPRLHSLSISRCYKLNCLPYFQSLNQLSLHSCLVLPAMPHLPSLKSLCIGNFQHLSVLSLAPELSSLHTLEVKYCKHLSHLEGLSDLISLKEMTLANCPELELKRDEQLPPELEVIKIHHSCHLLKEWCPPDFFQEFESDEVFLKRLTRDDLSGWISKV